MWLLGLVLLGAAQAEDGEDPRPDETAVGLGAVVGTGWASGPTLRLRAASGLSVDLTVGTSITKASEPLQFGDLQLDQSASNTSLASRLAVRIPFAQVGRTDLLVCPSVSGRLGWSSADQIDLGSIGGGESVTIRSKTRSRSIRAGAALEMDHWITERAALTGGLGLRALTAEGGTNQIGDDEAQPFTRTAVGLTTTAQAGLLVFF